MRPVHHRAGDQVGIRNDHRGAREGLDFGRTHIDATDIPLAVADHYPVADLDRPLDQQDQAGDEIVHDILQAETDTDRQCTGDDRQIRQVEADRADGSNAGQQITGIGQAGDHRIAHAGIDAALLFQPGIEAAAQQTGDADADHQHNDGPQDVTQRYGHRADGDAVEEFQRIGNQRCATHAPGQRQGNQQQEKQDDIDQQAQEDLGRGAHRAAQAQHLTPGAEPTVGAVRQVVQAIADGRAHDAVGRQRQGRPQQCKGQERGETVIPEQDCRQRHQIERENHPRQQTKWPQFVAQLPPEPGIGKAQIDARQKQRHGGNDQITARRAEIRRARWRHQNA